MYDRGYREQELSVVTALRDAGTLLGDLEPVSPGQVRVEHVTEVIRRWQTEADVMREGP